MQNILSIKVVAALLAVLGVLYIGNLVVNSTPASDAEGPYEYLQVMGPEECIELEAGSIEQIEACQTDFLNQKAKEGWELDQAAPGQLSAYIFKREL